LRLFVFQLTAALLLWFYSTDFKKKLLLGNLLVALLSATVAFMPFVYEMALMQKHDSGFMLEYQRMILSAMKITLLFCVFAFITSLAREIIKDIEDYEGDKATGGLTMPVIWGIRTSKFNAFFLLLITSLLLMFVVYNTIKVDRVFMSLNNLYILLLLILPLLFLAVYVLKAKKTREFSRASLVLKIVMLMGLCYSFVFYYS
jgi:4-hydroxybenzoate polyprenyltransferase